MNRTPPPGTNPGTQGQLEAVIQQQQQLQQELEERLRETQEQMQQLRRDMAAQNQAPLNDGPPALVHHDLDQHIPQVINYNFRLPTFWKTKPDLWFAQIESTFRKKNVNQDRAKYDAVVEALDEAAISEVSDIITQPPRENLYNNLKENLIKRHTDSADRQLHKLLSEIELGDKKPSQLLRHMKDLAKDKAGDELIRSRWMALLPGSVRNILRVCGEPTLAGLADVADSIMENSDPTILAINNGNKTKNVNQPPNNPTIDSRLTALEKTLAELTVFIKKSMDDSDERHSRSHSRSRGKKRNKSHGRSDSPSDNQTPRECYYHRTYKDKAQHCLQPCSYTQKNTKQNNEEN